MSGPRTRFIALNLAGGIAVLASYVLGLSGGAEGIWGGVPESWKPVYTGSMLLAAAGYFPFTYYFLTRFDPAPDERVGWSAVLVCYALVLVCSALWLPLTSRMLTTPSSGLWAMIRIDLLLVGIGAVGLLLILLWRRARDGSPAFWLAVVGLLPFCWQTAILDALVWPAFFP
jgi:hypothetical protein